MTKSVRIRETPSGLPFAVDHVAIITPTAEADFNAARREMKLPELWPYSDFGPIKTGAIWAGGLGIEFTTLDGAPNEPRRIVGLALSSSMSAWQIAERLRELDIRHTPPVTVEPIGAGGFGWRTVMVGDVISGQPKTIWLGRRFGGSHPMAKWISNVAGWMSQTADGLKRLNAAIDRQIVFFVDYSDLQEAEVRRHDAANALAGLTDDEALERPSVEIGLLPGSTAAARWSRLIGERIQVGRKIGFGATEFEFVWARQAAIRRVILPGLPAGGHLPSWLNEILSIADNR